MLSSAAVSQVIGGTPWTGLPIVARCARRCHLWDRGFGVSGRRLRGVAVEPGCGVPAGFPLLIEGVYAKTRRGASRILPAQFPSDTFK